MKRAKLTSILQSADSHAELSNYLNEVERYRQQLSFPSYLESLMQLHGISKADAITRSGIERTYGYQILNGRRSPGRDKVLLLCLAINCTLQETQRALHAAGLPVLYPKDQRDSVIIFAINKGLSPIDTNSLLEEFQMRLLD